MRKTCLVITTVFLFCSLVFADSVVTTKSYVDKMPSDPYGFSYSAGYLLEAPYESSSGDFLNFSADVERPGCGVVGLIGDISSLLNAQQLEQSLANIAQSAIYSLPLFLMSYASPTMADVYKHMRMWAQAIARWDMAQCQAVEEAAMKAGAYYGGIMDSRSVCIKKKIAEGKSLHEAVSECNRDNKFYNFVTGSPTREYNLATIVADRLKIKIPKDTPMGQYVRAVLGDYSYENGHVEGSLSTAAAEALLGEREKRARNDVSQVVKAYLLGGPQACYKKIEELSADEESVYHGRIVPFSCSSAAAVASLPTEEQQVAINAVSESIALLQLYDDILKLLQQLNAIADEAAAKGHGVEAEQIRKSVDKMEEQADVLWKRYLAQKEVADRIMKAAIYSYEAAAAMREGTREAQLKGVPPSSLRPLGSAGSLK